MVAVNDIRGQNHASLHTLIGLPNIMANDVKWLMLSEMGLETASKLVGQSEVESSANTLQNNFLASRRGVAVLLFKNKRK